MGCLGCGYLLNLVFQSKFLDVFMGREDPVEFNIWCIICIVCFVKQAVATQQPDLSAYTKCDEQLIKVAPDDGLK